MSEKIVEVNNLNFSYENTLVLENIDMSIEKGEFIGIVGPNGSAKSTLVKTILGILKPDSGQVRLFGEDIKTFNDWHRVGYISQKATQINVSFPATVEEIVSANLYSLTGFFKRIGKLEKKRVDEALELVGMLDRKISRIGELSGGQQQRVFIARLLVSKPEIMFLDEPTVGIDTKAEEQLYALLGRLNKEHGITIVMITHDIGAITDKVSRLACMSNRNLFMNHGCNIDEEFLTKLYGHKVHMQHHHHHE